MVKNISDCARVTFIPRQSGEWWVARRSTTANVPNIRMLVASASIICEVNST